MNLITAVWSQRVLAMPMSLVLIGRVERGDSAYWLARGGAFDSLARTSSTRQSLVRETTSFMYRQKHRNCKPRAYVSFRRPFFSFFPSCVGLLFVNTVIDSSLWFCFLPHRISVSLTVAPESSLRRRCFFPAVKSTT